MTRNHPVIGTLAAVLAVAAAGCARAGSQPAGDAAPAHGSSPAAYSVTYHPGDFIPNVDNPLFPLKPGTTLVYRGTKDETPALEYFTVTRETQKIDGVPCRVIIDRLYVHGKLAETTRDYYTQDRKGNVWYFGEDTATLDPTGSMIGTAGTFHAGEAGALPGVFMPASPKVGETHQQEYYVGHAEDRFKVLGRSGPVSVPYRSFTGALLTEEWTPLEPDVLDHKYFAPGVGMVKVASVKGAREEMVLIQVRSG